MTNLTVTDRRRLTAIRAARLFDGTSSQLLNDPVVVLDGATVRSVETGTEPPPGADVVDLGTATLLPGLIDTHVHLAFDASRDPVGRLAARSDEEVLAAMADARPGRPARDRRGGPADHLAARALPFPGRGR